MRKRTNLVVEFGGHQFLFKLHQLLHLPQKPPIDLSQLVDLIDRPPHLHRVTHVIQPALARYRELSPEFFRRDGPLVVERFAWRGLVRVERGIPRRSRWALSLLRAFVP